MNSNTVKMALTMLLLAGLASCSTQQAQTNTPERYAEVVKPDPQGVEEAIYEPPMVDIVDVPPGLDPEGIYYRPGHQEVVEIRQGRWKYKEKQR